MSSTPNTAPADQQQGGAGDQPPTAPANRAGRKRSRQQEQDDDEHRHVRVRIDQVRAEYVQNNGRQAIRTSRDHGVGRPNGRPRRPSAYLTPPRSELPSPVSTTGGSAASTTGPVDDPLPLHRIAATLRIPPPRLSFRENLAQARASLEAERVARAAPTPDATPASQTAASASPAPTTAGPVAQPSTPEVPQPAGSAESAPQTPASTTAVSATSRGEASYPPSTPPSSVSSGSPSPIDGGVVRLAKAMGDLTGTVKEIKDELAERPTKEEFSNAFNAFMGTVRTDFQVDIKAALEQQEVKIIAALKSELASMKKEAATGEKSTAASAAKSLRDAAPLGSGSSEGASSANDQLQQQQKKAIAGLEDKVRDLGKGLAEEKQNSEALQKQFDTKVQAIQKELAFEKQKTESLQQELDATKAQLQAAPQPSNAITKQEHEAAIANAREQIMNSCRTAAVTSYLAVLAESNPIMGCLTIDNLAPELYSPFMAILSGQGTFQGLKQTVEQFYTENPGRWPGQPLTVTEAPRDAPSSSVTIGTVEPMDQSEPEDACQPNKGPIPTVSTSWHSILGSNIVNQAAPPVWNSNTAFPASLPIWNGNGWDADETVTEDMTVDETSFGHSTTQEDKPLPDEPLPDHGQGLSDILATGRKGITRGFTGTSSGAGNELMAVNNGSRANQQRNRPCKFWPNCNPPDGGTCPYYHDPALAPPPAAEETIPKPILDLGIQFPGVASQPTMCRFELRPSRCKHPETCRFIHLANPNFPLAHPAVHILRQDVPELPSGCPAEIVAHADHIKNIVDYSCIEFYPLNAVNVDIWAERVDFILNRVETSLESASAQDLWDSDIAPNFYTDLAFEFVRWYDAAFESNGDNWVTTENLTKLRLRFAYLDIIIDEKKPGHITERNAFVLTKPRASNDSAGPSQPSAAPSPPAATSGPSQPSAASIQDVVAIDPNEYGRIIGVNKDFSKFLEPYEDADDL